MNRNEFAGRPTVDIVDGPSKFDLMTALFVWKPTRPWVTFRLADGRRVQASIVAVSAEDGSGESWNLEGNLAVSEPGGPSRRFRAYLRTSNRTGWMQHAA